MFLSTLGLGYDRFLQVKRKALRDELSHIYYSYQPIVHKLLESHPLLHSLVAVAENQTLAFCPLGLQDLLGEVYNIAVVES